MAGAVLDACVLYPAALRDTLLRAAERELYQLYLTKDILTEVERNVAQRIGPAKARRLVRIINEHFAECLVRRHGALEPGLAVNPKVRHVLAAAIAAGAGVIVTFNLRDFPPDTFRPWNIRAESPDDFLVSLLVVAPDGMVQLVREAAAALIDPSMSVEQLLDVLAKTVPAFVRRVRSVLA